MSSFTPRECMKDFMRVVLPAPRVPLSPTTDGIARSKMNWSANSFISA